MWGGGGMVLMRLWWWWDVASVNASRERGLGAKILETKHDGLVSSVPHEITAEGGMVRWYVQASDGAGTMHS
jgi:hypothetical protein